MIPTAMKEKAASLDLNANLLQNLLRPLLDQLE